MTIYIYIYNFFREIGSFQNPRDREIGILLYFSLYRVAVDFLPRNNAQKEIHGLLNSTDFRNKTF